MLCASQTAQEFPDLQTAVASLCALWWQKELPGREQLVAQLTVYLCARALTSGANLPYFPFVPPHLVPRLLVGASAILLKLQGSHLGVLFGLPVQ